VAYQRVQQCSETSARREQTPFDLENDERVRDGMGLHWVRRRADAERWMGSLIGRMQECWVSSSGMIESR
jgi:hypothetical protein